MDTTGSCSSSLRVRVSNYPTSFLHALILVWCTGIPAFFLGILTLFFLPDRPETTPFLKDGPERDLAVERVNRGAKAEAVGTINKGALYSRVFFEA